VGSVRAMDVRVWSELARGWAGLKAGEF